MANSLFLSLSLSLSLCPCVCVCVSVFLFGLWRSSRHLMPSHSQQKQRQARAATAFIGCQQSVVRADTKSNQRIQIDCTVHCFHINMFVSYVLSWVDILCMYALLLLLDLLLHRSKFYSNAIRKWISPLPWPMSWGWVCFFFFLFFAISPTRVCARARSLNHWFTCAPPYPELHTHTRTDGYL